MKRATTLLGLMGLALPWACSGSYSPSFPDGGNFVVGGNVNPAHTELVNGDYSWSVVSPPRFGGGLDRVAVLSPTDVWLVGHGIRHFDGTSVQTVPLPARVSPFSVHREPPREGPSGLFPDMMNPPDLAATIVDASAPAPDFAVAAADAAVGGPADAGVTGPGADESADLFDSLAVVSPTDIWACGTRPIHFDGSRWSDATSAIPRAASGPDPQVGAYRCEVAAGGGVAFLVQSGDTLAAEMGNHEAPIYGLFQVGSPDWTLAGTYSYGPPPYTLLVTPDGKPAQYGVGVLSNGGAPTAGLRGGQATWGKSSTRIYSWNRHTTFAPNDMVYVDLVAADIPGDFQIVAGLGAGQLPAVGSFGPITGAAPAYAPAMFESDFTSVVPTADGALYLVRAVDDRGEFAYLVRLAGTTATVLADRLYGWEPYQVAVIGADVLVTTSSGAILRGSKR